MTTVGHHRRIIAGTESAENALSARRSFAAAEASNGASAIDGTATPSTSSRRFRADARPRPTVRGRLSSASGAPATASTRRMPMPRTSIRPAIAAGAVPRARSPARRSSAWSSATRRAPASISRRARSDFPAPDGPRSKTARPSIAMAVAWTRTGSRRDRYRHTAAGSRTEKPAPMVAPFASLRFSAQIMPRCASTICFEIESPSPECVPNFSPSGRSV